METRRFFSIIVEAHSQLGLWLIGVLGYIPCTLLHHVRGQKKKIPGVKLVVRSDRLIGSPDRPSVPRRWA